MSTYSPYHVKHYKQRVELVRQYKNQPCADCGGTFPPYVMDFDHRDPATKKFNILRRAAGHSWKAVEEEIAKCDVVCANCHRIRTRKQIDLRGV